MIDLSGKTAVVTGASRGIGAAAARELAGGGGPALAFNAVGGDGQGHSDALAYDSKALFLGPAPGSSWVSPGRVRGPQNNDAPNNQAVHPHPNQKAALADTSRRESKPRLLTLSAAKRMVDPPSP